MPSMARSPSGWELALTAGMVALAVTLGEERKDELMANTSEPMHGWEREVRRSCDRTHAPCQGLGVCYEMKHRPKLHLKIWECVCVKYEVVYSPILIPSDRQLTGEDEAAPAAAAHAGPSIQVEML